MASLKLSVKCECSLASNRDCGPREGQLKIAILLLAELKLRGDAHRGIRQRLTVHVVDGGSQQQKATDPPPPRPPPVLIAWLTTASARTDPMSTGSTRRKQSVSSPPSAFPADHVAVTPAGIPDHHVRPLRPELTAGSSRRRSRTGRELLSPVMTSPALMANKLRIAVLAPISWRVSSIVRCRGYARRGRCLR